MNPRIKQVTALPDYELQPGRVANAFLPTRVNQPIFLMRKGTSYAK